MSRSPRSNVRRLALGRLISVTGGAAAFTALNFTVWDRTHSPWMQALSLLLTFGVAGLMGPFAGALGDRFDRRKVLIWSEAISAVFFAAMAFVAFAPGADPAGVRFGDRGTAVLLGLASRDPQPGRDVRTTSRGRTAW